MFLVDFDKHSFTTDIRVKLKYGYCIKRLVHVVVVSMCFLSV